MIGGDRTVAAAGLILAAALFTSSFAALGQDGGLPPPKDTIFARKILMGAIDMNMDEIETMLAPGGKFEPAEAVEHSDTISIMLMSFPHLFPPSTNQWQPNVDRDPATDTVAILPQAPLAISEAAGIPNNGDMRVVERIHLADKDILHVDLEIFAPKILTKPWKTTRIFFRQRARKFDIVEGVCVQGDYSERVDANGDHVFVPVEKTIWGNIVPK